jgi:acyl-CoA-binding protein
MSINKVKGNDKWPTWEEFKGKNDDNHRAYRSGTYGVQQKVESYLAQGIIEYYA